MNQDDVAYYDIREIEYDPSCLYITLSFICRVGESVESALALAAIFSALSPYFNNIRQKILYFDVLRQKRVLFNCFATKQCLGMLKMRG